MLRLLWRQRKMIWATTQNDVRARFSGTALGLAWVLIYPVLFLGLYAVVYTLIFKVRAASFSTTDYVLLIFCGLVPFLGFAEALGAGVSCVTSNKSLIKNTLFPIELIPVKTVLASSLTMVVGMVLLLIVLWSRGIVHKTQAVLPLLLVLQIAFTLGVIWLLSAINVFFNDLSQVVSVLVLLLMLVSPIAYTRDMIPPELMPIMYPNPLYYLIMLYRDAAFLGQIQVPLLGAFTLITATSFGLGALLFQRLKGLFADYV
jgi:lipopolysaccharide transport system permease protein